jgi:hypothetical protein
MLDLNVAVHPVMAYPAGWDTRYTARQLDGLAVGGATVAALWLVMARLALAQ